MRTKSIRTKGKLQLSRYFQEFNEGDIVTVSREISMKADFPARLQGRTGIVKKRKGKVYNIEIKDQEKNKMFLIAPIHLRKIGGKNDKK
jgi:ribosomal protein L21E